MYLVRVVSCGFVVNGVLCHILVCFDLDEVLFSTLPPDFHSTPEERER